MSSSDKNTISPQIQRGSRNKPGLEFNRVNLPIQINTFNRLIVLDFNPFSIWTRVIMDREIN